jgi:hypothetical protein
MKARMLAAALAATMALLALPAVNAGAAPAAAPPPVNCGRAHGPFHVSHARVIGRGGQAFIPLGITVPGLAMADPQAETQALDAQITATAKWWCANTVRLQVGQASLVGPDPVPGYLAEVKAAVSLAEQHGLVVVISDQTEYVGQQPAPTSATVAFWKRLSAVYGHDSQVIFDLFNEPRTGAAALASTWQLWRNGGTFQGVKYLGMQQLATDIRADGAANLFWIEGPQTAGSLAEVGRYLITGAGPIAYDYHHPAGPHTVASWQSNFGYLVTGHIAPVVDGEWTNYAAPKGECWANAPAQVPAYLSYLRKLGIGLAGWMLAPGVLIKTTSLWDPTHINPATWACTKGLDQGAGSALMNWFKSQNKLK